LILDLNCKQKNIIFSKKLVSEKNKIKTKEAEKQKNRKKKLQIKYNL
jgi:hypothetical protein